MTDFPEGNPFFQPTFVAGVLREFLRTFSAKSTTVPMEYCFLVTPLALSEPFRGFVRGNSRSNLVAMIGANPELKVGLADRSMRFRGLTWEAIELLVALGEIRLTDAAEVDCRALATTEVAESDRSVAAARLLGNVLSKMGNSSSVFSLFEVAV